MLPFLQPPTPLLFKIHFPFPLRKRIGLQERTANKTKQDMIRQAKALTLGLDKATQKAKESEVQLLPHNTKLMVITLHGGPGADPFRPGARHIRVWEPM